MNNFSVITTNNGMKALELFNKHRGSIDLIITDLCMPKLNGIDLIQKIRKVNTTIPIIVATASDHVFYENQLTGNSVQVQGFLPKPFSSEQLLFAINSAIELYKETNVKF